MRPYLYDFNQTRMRLTKSISVLRPAMVPTAYEGINIGSGARFIAYMRTDLDRISPVAQNAGKLHNDRLVASIPGMVARSRMLRCSRCPRLFVHLAS